METRIPTTYGKSRVGYAVHYMYVKYTCTYIHMWVAVLNIFVFLPQTFWTWFQLSRLSHQSYPYKTMVQFQQTSALETGVASRTWTQILKNLFVHGGWRVRNGRGGVAWDTNF